jgi:hypothetical protein
MVLFAYDSLVFGNIPKEISHNSWNITLFAFNIVDVKNQDGLHYSLEDQHH